MQAWTLGIAADIEGEDNATETRHLGTWEPLRRAVKMVLIPGNWVPEPRREHGEQGQVEQGPSGSETVRT